MTQPFVGMIAQVGFNFAPRGWQIAAGQVISIQQNAALFSLLGTFYGGNGTTTFALPNLLGRVAIGYGQGPGLPNYNIGQVGGSNNVPILQSNMPQHTHTFNVSDVKSSAQVPPAGGTIGHSKDGASSPVSVPEIYCPAGTATATTLQTSMIGFTGGSQPLQVAPPYLAINYIIAMQGIFPSRN